MLTVAILNFNGMDTLRESIQSVLDQTLKPDRFVVIDNASTDASRQIAVDMGVEVVDADNRCKFITGLNRAIACNRELLFFMQNDVTLSPNCLEKMIWGIPEGNFIAQPIIYQTDGKVDNAGMDYNWPGYGERRTSNKFGPIYRTYDAGLVTTICFLTNNRSLLYDELFSPAYYEDIDFYLRTRDTFKHLIVPSASAIHRGNHTFSQTLKKLQISAICRKNRRKLINKHYSGLDWLIRSAVLSLLDVGKEAFDIVADWWVTLNNRKKDGV